MGGVVGLRERAWLLCKMTWKRVLSCFKFCYLQLLPHRPSQRSFVWSIQPFLLSPQAYHLQNVEKIRGNFNYTRSHFTFLSPRKKCAISGFRLAHFQQSLSVCLALQPLFPLSNFLSIFFYLLAIRAFSPFFKVRTSLLALRELTNYVPINFLCKVTTFSSHETISTTHHLRDLMSQLFIRESRAPWSI